MRSAISRHLTNLLAHEKLAVRSASFRLSSNTADRHDLPMEFSYHDYAVYLLHIAAEIEHTLMVQYLYAGYSLGGPEVSPAQQAQVMEWQKTILGIAKEEMGHFMTVQNILRLLGGELNLDRQDFPWDIPFYPYDFALEPLTRASLAKYIFAESPSKWPDGLSQEERKEIEAAVHMTPEEMPHRVGELYDLMIDLLSDSQALPDSLFRGETFAYQASWDEWGRGYNGVQRGSNHNNPSPNVILSRLASRSDAVSALKQIAEQGESPDDSSTSMLELSHFERFLKIFREFPAADAKWSPTWKVPTNPQAPGLYQGTAGPIITDPEAGSWSTLFNVRYRMLLAYLAHSFRISSSAMESGASNPRSLIINSTFNEMYQLRGIAGILVQSPLNDKGGPERAGPPFQVPYAVQLPMDESDCWMLHIDLIDSANRLLSQLSGQGKHAAYANTLVAADALRRRQFEELSHSSHNAPHSQRSLRSIAV